MKLVPMKKEREFTYMDGIIEGRLIENGFTAVGDGIFSRVSHKDDHCFIVMYSGQDGKGIAELEVFEFIPELPKEGIETRAYIELCREEANLKHELSGEIHEIIGLAKALIKFYSKSE